MAYFLKTTAEGTDQKRYGKVLKGWESQIRSQGQTKLLGETQDIENQESVEELDGERRRTRSDRTAGYK